MRFDAQTKVVRFVDCGLQLFRRELLRLRIAAVGQHGSARMNLNVIGAVVRELTDDSPHFPRAVRLAETQVPGQRNIGSKASRRARSTGNGDVRSGNEHARTDDVSTIDRVAQGNVDES